MLCLYQVIPDSAAATPLQQHLHTCVHVDWISTTCEAVTICVHALHGKFKFLT